MDRAQAHTLEAFVAALILVAGLTVAVILVMLVLLLNTVIYTENLATRGIDSEAADAIEYRATVVGSIEELIEQENEHYDEGYPPEEGLEEGISIINGTVSEQHLERGTIAEISSYNISLDMGSTLIWQNEPSNFPEVEDSMWPVATSVSEVQQYEIRIDDIKSGEGPFLIQIDKWQMTIEKETDDSDWIVTIGEETREIPGGEPLKIDIDDGEINDEAWWIAPEDEPSFDDTSITFKNGSIVTGTLDLRINGNEGEALTEYDGGSGEGPYYTHPVDSVDLTIHYETSQMHFVTEETIVPAEEP